MAVKQLDKIAQGHTQHSLESATDNKNDCEISSYAADVMYMYVVHNSRHTSGSIKTERESEELMYSDRVSCGKERKRERAISYFPQNY